MPRILKQTHFEGRQCSKNIPILMVTCGKHSHIEGLFPVVLNCTNLITVYEPETKYWAVLYSYYSDNLRGVNTLAGGSGPTL